MSASINAAEAFLAGVDLSPELSELRLAVNTMVRDMVLQALRDAMNNNNPELRVAMESIVATYVWTQGRAVLETIVRETLRKQFGATPVPTF